MSDYVLNTSNIKYKALYTWLIGKINDGSFGYKEKLPSEASLCEQFQISRQTVRNAMDRLCREGYVERVKGSGSFVKKPVRQREKTIGVIFLTISGYINANVLNGIENVLSSKGYSILLELSHNRVGNEARFLQKMLASNVSGLIIEGTKSSFPTPNDALFRQLAEQKIPYVFVHNGYTNVPAPAIVWDDRRVSYELTQRLINAGHKNIAGLFKFDEMQGVNRYLGYIDALMDNQMEIQEDYIGWYSDSNQPEERRRKTNYADAFAMDILGHCSALICYNDLIACHIIRHYIARGISIPDQVSVASFDNSDVTKLYNLQRIPSVTHPKEEMGRQAASLLMEYIENPSLNAAERKIITL
ncbi:GntR family transcriptional regulator [Qiania dongpingensis]|uniref:GntR family transcriptional regulator n=1 Tax=Qiania dongpingensis TaxID=2763669 RepID=A0A7G9G265_9FIRM|nr:GntR family transcriptional regulator [Qiania dongpingensis]QNM04897.1 GntR family transcriptional regulator [Qiania dongpingensis]